MNRLLERLVRVMAAAALAGPLEMKELRARWARVLSPRPRWALSLARRLIQHFGAGSRPRHHQVDQFLRSDFGLRKAIERGPVSFQEKLIFPVMCPASGPPCSWEVPSLVTPGELATWLRLSLNELAWFADLRGLGTRHPQGPLSHYHYRWVPKRDGTARLIESPKLRLKFFQRAILHAILDRIPPHEAVHGFRVGRSVSTFVEQHVGRDFVLRLDLKDFFASVTRPRVTAVFLTAGYPEPVAQLLAGLCTHRTPRSVWRARPGGIRRDLGQEEARRWEIPHLPQGAPSSPALANLVAYRLDCRLDGLAKSAGAAYSRYADDLLFSGEAAFARVARRFLVQVGAIALEEGFEVNARKTRLMHRSVSQRAGGLVINAHPNLPRDDYDRLKAILYNCVKHGPVGQNRAGVENFAAHLAGRVAHVRYLNPVRGERLQRRLDQIVWEG